MKQAHEARLWWRWRSRFSGWITSGPNSARNSPRPWLVSIEAAGSCDPTAVEGFAGYPCGGCNSPRTCCSALGQAHVDAGKSGLKSTLMGSKWQYQMCPAAQTFPSRGVYFCFFLFLFFLCCICLHVCLLPPLPIPLWSNWASCLMKGQWICNERGHITRTHCDRLRTEPWIVWTWIQSEITEQHQQHPARPNEQTS